MKNKLLLEIERQKKLMGINEDKSILKESGPGTPYGWGGLLLKRLLGSTEPALTRIKSRFEEAYNELGTKSSNNKLKQKGVTTFNELVDDTKKVNTHATVKGSDDEYKEFAKDFILKIFKESKYQDVRETVLEEYKNIFASETRKALDDLEALAEAGEKEAFEAGRLDAERRKIFDPVILNYLETKLLKTKRDLLIDPKNSHLQDEAFKNYLQRLDPDDQDHVNMMINHARNGDYKGFIADKNALSKPLDPEMLRYVERFFKIGDHETGFFTNMLYYFTKNDLIFGQMIGGLVRKFVGKSEEITDEIKIQFRNIIDDISNDVSLGRGVNLNKLEELNQLSRKIVEFNRTQIKQFWDETKQVMPDVFLKKVQKPNGSFDENIFVDYIKVFESASDVEQTSMLVPPQFVSKLDGLVRFWRGRGADNIEVAKKSIRWKNRAMRLCHWAGRGAMRVKGEIINNEKILGGKVGKWWLVPSSKYAGYQTGELVMTTLVYAPFFIGFVESMLALIDRKITSYDFSFIDDEAFFGGGEKTLTKNPGYFIRTIFRSYIAKHASLDPDDVIKSLSKGFSPAIYTLLTQVEGGGTPELTVEKIYTGLESAKVDTSQAHRVNMEYVPNYQNLADSVTTIEGYNGNIDSLLNRALSQPR